MRILECVPSLVPYCKQLRWRKKSKTIINLLMDFSQLYLGWSISFMHYLCIIVSCGDDPWDMLLILLSPNIYRLIHSVYIKVAFKVKEAGKDVLIMRC